MLFIIQIIFPIILLKLISYQPSLPEYRVSDKLNVVSDTGPGNQTVYGHVNLSLVYQKVGKVFHFLSVTMGCALQLLFELRCHLEIVT